ncbi:hypothetical protein [Pseudomonas syringae]|uniref:hypothetical protein n=1 Tax=Pseudomonas syringae TaxID=317 RepID=UPI001BCAA3D4|nr:hypothetical protein [Pseudomonas syringae]MBS7461122.1 hypothetical protein [Pseudomonas syringae]
MKSHAMMRDIRVIALDKIKLDQENVRFGNDIAQNQREAIKLMLADPDDAKKILRLAEHIVEHGLDPTELQLVTSDEDGNFIVLEGNRRLTALKLLQRPDLCPTDRGYKGFLKAHNNLADGVPESLQCSVVSSRAAGDIWVELKHTGENRGIGRVGWDSDIRDERRARQTGIESIGRQLRNMINDNQHIFTQKAALDCLEVDVTTLTRLFSSTIGQNFFRLKVENKILTPQLPLVHIAPSVEFMLDMFVSHGYNVNDVRADPDRIKTLGHIPPEILPDNLAELSKGKPPASEVGGDGNKGKNGGESHSDGGQDSGTTKGSSTGGSEAEKPEDGGNTKPDPQKDPSTRAKPQSRARKYLLPWSFSIKNTRINAIYRELRTVLKVDDCPNATAITFRVFLETTCDEFIKIKKDAGTPILRWDTNAEIRGGVGGDKLSLKVQAVIKLLETEKLVATGAAKAIFKRAGSYDQPGSIDHFNLFVHSAHGAPVPSELKDIAEEYRPMLEAIWA